MPAPRMPQMKTPTVDGDRTLTTHIHSPSEFLALLPDRSLEQIENSNVDEMTAEESVSLKAYEETKEKQANPSSSTFCRAADPELR
ncbi:hypothetical protein HispidOSU_018639 [Sigmodon hispidus]